MTSQLDFLPPGALLWYALFPLAVELWSWLICRSRTRRCFCKCKMGFVVIYHSFNIFIRIVRLSHPRLTSLESSSRNVYAIQLCFRIQDVFSPENYLCCFSHFHTKRWRLQTMKNTLICFYKDNLKVCLNVFFFFLNKANNRDKSFTDKRFRSILPYRQIKSTVQLCRRIKSRRRQIQTFDINNS